MPIACACCRPFAFPARPDAVGRPERPPSPTFSARPSRRAVLGGLAAGTLGAAGALPGAAEAGPLNELLGRFVSPAQERQLGDQAFRKLKQQTPRSRNAAMQTALERVAMRVIPASGSTIPLPQWELVVFAGDDINAFALPGGKVGFYEGIFRIMRDDAQLATVLGHEVGHVVARHSAERLGAEMATGVGGSLLGSVLGLDPASGIDRLIAGALGAGLQYGVLLPYDRGQELEADRLGLGYMAAAGYDPRAAIGFWQAMMRAGGGKPPAFLSTHPSDSRRIAEIEASLPAAEAAYARRRS